MEEEINKLESLLTQISIISGKYDKVIKSSGENYNIFRILKMETKEVRLHSAFLANLLDPNESHGQGDLFLRKFVKCFRIDGFEGLEKIDANVFKEEYVGKINEDGTMGGRIDIVIKCKKAKTIVIENKIYAKDQYNCLTRYKGKYPDSHLLYLTLQGKDPEKSSVGDLKENKDYYCISYKNDILQWLEECILVKDINSLVLKTITQYIFLIKKLTKQNTNEKMKKEIIEQIISSPNNIESAELISNSWDSIRYGILEKLKLIVTDTISVNLNLNCQFDVSCRFGDEESGFWVFPHNWKEHKICFYFVESGFEDIRIGIQPSDNKLINQELKEVIKQKLTGIYLGTVVSEDPAWFPDWMWVSEFDKWKNTKWKNVLDEFPRDIEDAIRGILTRLEGLDL